MTDLRRTPLYAEHVRLGARMVPFAGYEMPVQYKGISVEHTAVREHAGLFDVSHMGELWLTGPAAVATADSLITNDLGRLASGRALYTCCCNERGTILDDLIVYKFSPTRVLVVCNAGNRDKISAHFAERTRGKCDFEDASDRTALLALQGPSALSVLETLDPTWADLGRTLGRFGVAERELSGKPILVARTGYTGEDGVELFCSNEDAPPLFRGLLDAGKSHGIEPIGLGARDTLRLEARLSLYGNDIDETTNPIEAGLGWTVQLDKADFVGKAALTAIHAAGPERRLVGFEMVGRGVARHGYPLKDTAGKVVGVCTSGSPSPTLGTSIGLGYLPSNLVAVGTEFLVDCRGKDVAARVVRTPFYRRAQPS